LLPAKTQHLTTAVLVAQITSASLKIAVRRELSDVGRLSRRTVSITTAGTKLAAQRWFRSEVVSERARCRDLGDRSIS